MTPIYKIFIQKKFAPTYMCDVFYLSMTPIKIKNKKIPLLPKPNAPTSEAAIIINYLDPKN